MKRISTDAEYLDTGKLVIDADGIPVDLGYRGVGSPEGKIAAPVGSVYTDTAATNGAIRWIKTSGTGNTGWQVEYGDTGWRDITQSIPSKNLKSGAVYIRRSQNLVSIRFVALSSDIPARTTVFTLPPGFRPDQSSNYDISGYWGNHANTVAQISSNGAIGFRDPVSENTVNSIIIVTATASWPSVLPGTPT